MTTKPSRVLKLRRGTEKESDGSINTNFPTLEVGEIVYTTDTQKVYIGKGSGTSFDSAVEVGSPTLKIQLKKTIDELLQDIQNDKIVPNQLYRITDYSISLSSNVTTLGKIKVANTPHYFDIVVRGISTDQIDQVAWACISESDSSGYYTEDDIKRWKLKVDIDVNNSVYTSKLFITYLEDGSGNSANYDFKNIVSIGYKVVTADTKYLDTDSNHYFVLKGSNLSADSGITYNSSNTYELYTFSYYDLDNDKILDMSSVGKNIFTSGFIFENNKSEYNTSNMRQGYPFNCFIGILSDSSNPVINIFNNVLAGYSNIISPSSFINGVVTSINSFDNLVGYDAKQIKIEYGNGIVIGDKAINAHLISVKNVCVPKSSNNNFYIASSS